MISNQNRSWYIGASDSSMVVGNWKTETFRKWWQTKLGLDLRGRFDTKYTLAGTHYEHAILDTIPGVIKDKQIILPELSLRVNYDGIIEGDTIVIKEVKTHKEEKEFKVSKQYWRQAQVEIYAAEQYYGKPVRLDIVSYPMSEKHYRNYFIKVDKDMIRTTPVEKDPAFIGEYLKKLEYLKHCMDIGAFPTEGGYGLYRKTC